MIGILHDSCTETYPCMLCRCSLFKSHSTSEALRKRTYVYPIRTGVGLIITCEFAPWKDYILIYLWCKQMPLKNNIIWYASKKAEPYNKILWLGNWQSFHGVYWKLCVHFLKIHFLSKIEFVWFLFYLIIWIETWIEFYKRFSSKLIVSLFKDNNQNCNVTVFFCTVCINALMHFNKRRFF